MLGYVEIYSVFEFPAELGTFIEEIFNGKLSLLWTVSDVFSAPSHQL